MQIISFINFWNRSDLPLKFTQQAFIQALPNDLFEKIYKLLFSYDQVLIFPFVCKKWHDITLKYFKEPLKEIFNGKNGMISEIKNTQRIFLKFISANNSIAELMKTQFQFYKIDPWGTKKICEFSLPLSIWHEKINGTSNFNVFWSPDSYGIAMLNSFSIWNRMRSSYIFNLEVHRIIDKKTNTIYGLFFDIGTFSRYSLEKKNLFSWEKSKDEINEVTATIIDNLLTYELKSYIERLTDANMSKFSKISTINDISSKLFCHCDKLGRISEVDCRIENIYSGSDDCLNFDIDVVQFEDLDQRTITSFLKWETNDLNSFGDKEIDHTKYDFSQILRWIILSKTAELVAKKLGIGWKDI